jgi:hypothetical protein
VPTYERIDADGVVLERIITVDLSAEDRRLTAQSRDPESGWAEAVGSVRDYTPDREPIRPKFTEPNRTDLKPAWVQFAVDTRALTREEAEQFSKAELISHLTDDEDDAPGEESPDDTTPPSELESFDADNEMET